MLANNGVSYIKLITYLQNVQAILEVYLRALVIMVMHQSHHVFIVGIDSIVWMVAIMFLLSYSVIGLSFVNLRVCVLAVVRSPFVKNIKSHIQLNYILIEVIPALTLTRNNHHRKVSSGMPHYTSARTKCHTGADNVDSALAVVPVTIKLKNGTTPVPTYAFMDPDSNVSFCFEAIARELGACGIKIKMGTKGVTHTMNTHIIDGLIVENHDGDVL